jgi:integrase
MTFLMAVRRLGKDITVHGFRSSFRDWAAECTNFPSDVCEAALAHTIKNKAEAAYNRTDLFNKRADLMAAWAVFSTSAHIPQPTRKHQAQDRVRARPMHSLSRKS